jgi:hypothetical protein
MESPPGHFLWYKITFLNKKKHARESSFVLNEVLYVAGNNFVSREVTFVSQEVTLESSSSLLLKSMKWRKKLGR